MFFSVDVLFSAAVVTLPSGSTAEKVPNPRATPRQANIRFLDMETTLVEVVWREERFVTANQYTASHSPAGRIKFDPTFDLDACSGANHHIIR